MCYETRFDDLETEHRNFLANVAFVFSKMCQRRDDYCPLGLVVDTQALKIKSEKCPILGERFICCDSACKSYWADWLEQGHCMR